MAGRPDKVVRMWMEKAQRRTVLPASGGFHILRHTFCSRLAMQGAPAKAIQERWLGTARSR